MIIENPRQQDIPALRTLWQQAFGDTDAFLDDFFSLAFAPERALVAKEQNEILGALYWLDCEAYGKTMSYVYAVATEKKRQGQGICKALMAEMHDCMTKAGKGSILVPADDGLRDFYRRLGYQNFGGMDEAIYFAGDMPIFAEKLTADAYAQRRRQLLPEGGILQEGAFLPFMDAQMDFYGGEGWLLAIQKDFAPEYLGDKRLLPGILKALCLPQVRVRYAGEMPFAMCRGIEEENPKMKYFAFALD